MSNQFIGLTMLVTLSNPPQARLRGVVSSIEPGLSLTLRNVTSLANGKFVPEFTIKASEIVELVEAVNENYNSATTTIPQPMPLKPVAVNTKSFEDPAILSFGKRPAASSRPSISNISQLSPPLMEKDASERSVPADIELARNSVKSVPVLDREVSEDQGNEEQDIIGELAADTREIPVSPELSVTLPSKKTRRGRKHGRKAADSSFTEPDVIPAKETQKSKGWRQTPLLEPNPSFQPFSTLKKKNRRGEDENGWATEDATDVQELGDFDFVNNLAKFDKLSVFNQIKEEDGIAEEDRLVAHNRLQKPKPGTAGGKNLHYTENVLDQPNGSSNARDSWIGNTEDSDIEERASQLESSMRHSRGADSRLGRRPLRAGSKSAISRKGSGANTGQPARGVSTSTYSPSLVLPSGLRCEPISALQMLNLESIAENELGLSEDMMTENSGRGIADVALSSLNTGFLSTIREGAPQVASVIIYAGNNKSGLRAIAAGRHLLNHGLKVVACVLGLDHESELLVGLRKQLNCFRKFGGRTVNKSKLLEFLKTLSNPLDLIIDGLLGLTISFEELRLGDQATAYELIEYANRSQASVLAIDIPTGIDPTTGKISIIDGRELYLRPSHVIAMGAPKKGLLEAMALGEGVPYSEEAAGKDSGWKLWVADIGLGAAAWKKAGTRVRKGVDFESSWVLSMRFEGNEEL